MRKSKHHLVIKKRIFSWQIVSLGFLALLIIILVVINISIQSQTAQTLTTRATGPTCHPKCATEPSCCAQILKKYKDLGGTPDDLADLSDDEQPYHECEWTESDPNTNDRAYCRLSTCNQLPAGIKYRGHCGWYWNYHDGATNTADGYGCMIGTEDRMRPICNAGTNPTAPSNPNPSTTPPSNPTTTVSPVNCPTTSTESYDSWGVNPPDLNTNTNPDKNVFLRGYGETAGKLQLVTYGYPAGEPPDPKAPQLNSILKNGAQFLHLYKIHKWDWNNNRPSTEYEDYAPVSVLGLYAKPGQQLLTPTSGYVIATGYKAMLIYADEKSLAINWTGDDDAITGYAAHIDGICVDPNLLALYRQLNSAGRHKMPVLKDGQKMGTAKTNEVRVAIRDSGNFLDPRSKLDWWKNDSNVTPIPTDSNTPTPTGGGAHSVSIQVVDKTDPNNPKLFAGESTCQSSYTTNLSQHLSVYLTGPAKGPQGFGELLLIQGSANCSCKSKGGFPYTCFAGSAIWKGADGRSGTAAGNYTVQIQTLPTGWEKVTESASGTLASGGSLILNLSIRQKNGSTNPTPTGDIPTITPAGNLLSPTGQLSPTIIWNSYTNKDYELIINNYADESISAIDVSKWLQNAIRVPGLQTSICYPPNCVFR